MFPCWRGWRPERLRACVAALLTLALAEHPAAPAVASFTFPAQRRGPIEAVLEVSVADAAPTPGLGAVTYTIRVQGPENLEVLPPRLDDATDAWKTDGMASSWQGDTGGAAVTLTVPLHQVKPGPAPLPDVHLRVRQGQQEWQVEWLDILRQPRDVPGSAPSPASSSAAWLWASGLGAGALGVLLAAVLRRRRRVVPTATAPDARALDELERLEKSALPPAAPPEAFHTRLSEVVRRYLAERFGVKALEQTSAEFLAAARLVPQLGGQEPLLREFCERCDLAKFARAGLSAEECRRTASLARTLVEQTRSGPQPG
jgi:hypothetical protein